MATINSIDWIQSWYRAQCDGEWEHQYGVLIETLDNPGWVVKVDLKGTSLANAPARTLHTKGDINHLGIDGDQEWLDCKIEDHRFEGAGGPFSLVAICDIFMNWVESEKR